MKKPYIICILFVLLISCQKEETPESGIPQWLESRIEELEKSEQCKWYFINRYLYNEELYYDVVNVGINCILCEVYDRHGNLVDWNGDEDLEFSKGRTNETLIWSCIDTLP